MKSLFEVRLANGGDVGDVLDITKQAFEKYREMTGASRLDALEETADDVRQDIENKLVLVAVSDGEPVGCVRVAVDGDTALLTRFAVKVTNQNNGIGKSMMNHVDRLMAKNGVERLYLYTASKATPLIRFYYGRGFYVESTDTERGYVRARLVKEY